MTSRGGLFSISIEYKPGTPPRLHGWYWVAPEAGIDLADLEALLTAAF